MRIEHVTSSIQREFPRVRGLLWGVHYNKDYRMLVVYVGSLFTETAIFDGAADTCSG